MHKRISSLIGVVIILAAVVIVGGGVLGYQYWWMPGSETSKNLNYDELLHKLFPSLFFKDGVAELPNNIMYSGINLHLEDLVEDYFINKQEKSLLLVTRLDGIGHAGGLYHAYLGLFDKNGNLLTPSSLFGSEVLDTGRGGDHYDFYKDKSQFGGDIGKFGFYDCKGVKYILFVSSGCPNGTCCSAGARLFRINNGNFEDVQIIDEDSLAGERNSLLSIILPKANAAGDYSDQLKMTLSGDKILVKKVPFSSYTGCPETDYKELSWDESVCRFE